MDNFNAVVTAIGTLIAVAGSSGLGYIIKQMLHAQRLRAEARTCSEHGHAETQRLLLELKIAQQEVIVKLQAQNSAKDKRITRLERDLSTALLLAKKKINKPGNVNNVPRFLLFCLICIFKYFSKKEPQSLPLCALYSIIKDNCMKVR